MARRKGRFVKRARAAFGGFRRRIGRRSSSGGENLLITAGAAALYGATRPKIEQWVAPVTSKLPLGNYADEIVLGGLGYFMAKGKLGNNKYVRSAGKAMLIIEAARAGSGMAAGLMPTSSNGSNWNVDY